MKGDANLLLLPELRLGTPDKQSDRSTHYSAPRIANDKYSVRQYSAYYWFARGHC